MRKKEFMKYNLVKYKKRLRLSIFLNKSEITFRFLVGTRNDKNSIFLLFPQSQF